MTKIIQLNAENVKILKAVEIKPEGNIVELTGKNGQGKSSVIDSIIMGIMGKKFQPEKPVREGEQEANIIINMGNLVIKRKIKTDGTSILKVETAEGASFSSPQAMLDELVSNISFDPLQFSNMKAKDQFEQLKQVVKIDFDFENNESLRKGAYEDRTIINRELKDIEAQEKSITYPGDTPNEVLSISELFKELESEEKFNQEQSLLFNKTKELEVKLENLLQQIENTKKELNSFKKPQKLKDIVGLKEKIQNAEKINSNVSLKNKQKDLKEKIKVKTKLSESLTQRIEGYDNNKKTAIESCKMPVEGLSFGEGVVLFNGIPLEQCSQAEKIKISTSIAMSNNNDKQLKIVLIKDGSLLDEDNMKIITDMAKEKDYQVWIEKVDSTGKIGIVIEDGEIKTINKG